MPDLSRLFLNQIIQIITTTLNLNAGIFFICDSNKRGSFATQNGLGLSLLYFKGTSALEMRNLDTHCPLHATMDMPSSRFLCYSTPHKACLM